MKKFFKSHALVAAFVVTAALAAPFALAQQPTATDKTARHEHHAGMMGGHRHHRGEIFGFGFRNLDLTDAQKAQIKQIHESHRESLKALRDQIRAKHQELRQVTESGTFNESLAAQKLTEVAPLKAKLMAEHFKIRQETLAVLTPEQKAKLDSMREQFKERMKERRERRS
ncbi:MAG TPA: Spy/CpxP family protein refolding chaperone [Blastocatellia bacterium]|nr:Spy/CpxP family protein refolding chaperone [Blastocatellia bacterium]